jgi:hypothetical protein
MKDRETGRSRGFGFVVGPQFSTLHDPLTHFRPRDLTIGGEGLLDVTAREQRRAQYVTRRGEVDVEA